MAITYDPTKRAEALEERSLDFEDAVFVFAGPTFETEDLRKDYGEKRIICFGMLRDRMVVVGYRAAWRGSPHLQHEESK